MDPRSSFDGLVASITFSGSLISFLATTAVLICYVVYRSEQRSFRHALIFNLALAEFINTLNNTISGAIYLREHVLWPGTGCTINGFIGQLSVQAADFSILVIAVVTLLTITRTTYMPAASTLYKCAICASVWVVPFITATTATAMGRMGPVSGNWCWIMKEYTDLRYALTHGWRIAIIFCTAGIYIFVWWYMNRHFRSMVSTMTPGNTTGASKASWYRRRRGFKKMKDGNGAEGGPGPGPNESGSYEEQDTELSTMSKSRISRVGVDEWELSAPEAALARANSDEFFDPQVVGDQKQANKHVKSSSKQQQRRRRRSSFLDSGTDDDDDEEFAHDNADDDQDHGRRPQQQGGGDPHRHHYHQTDLESNNNNHHHPHMHHPTGPLGSNPPNVEVPPRKSQYNTVSTQGTMASEFPKRRQTREMEREIKRMLLLNAYPVMYVILWIPGLVNRFMEATGNSSGHTRALSALQASSQFVGLANALTYGFNKALRTRVKRWWRERRPAAAARGRRGGGAVRRNAATKEQRGPGAKT